MPDFSWKLPVEDNIKSQTAYQLVVASDPKLLPNHADLWDSFQKSTDQSIHIPYEGKKLKSRQKVYWQVKFWDNAGKESQWSEIAHFELGLLNNSDWTGKWISLPSDQLTEQDRHKQRK